MNSSIMERTPLCRAGLDRHVTYGNSNTSHRNQHSLYGMPLKQRRLPPYANTVKKFIDRPHASLIVIAGPHAWAEARKWGGKAIVLPPIKPPEYFDWSIVTHPRHAVIIDTGENVELLKRLARCLVRAGANHVAVLPMCGRLAFFKPAEVSHAA